MLTSRTYAAALYRTAALRGLREKKLLSHTEQVELTDLERDMYTFEELHPAQAETVLNKVVTGNK